MEAKTSNLTEEQKEKKAVVAALRGEIAEVKIIATGGMSQIFRARQPALDRFVVVKKLKEDLLSQSETVERFRREAKALASVLHQNVAHVYDFVEGGTESYIVMEYIDGIDVSKVVEKVGFLPPDVAAAILLGVTKGVSYIHAHHLIHRDIKPSNIRLTTRGEVKLMDFGIVMDIENQALTRPGMMVGSPSYLSPEQVLGDSITTSADIFLLGITFYEMLTGTRPFKEEAGETIFQRIREAKYIPARKMQTQIPLQLDQIVRRCLQKDPNRRYKKVKDVVAALEQFLGPMKSSHSEDLVLRYLDGEALISPAVSVSDISAEGARWKRWITLPGIVLAVATLLLGAALGYFWGASGNPPTGPDHFPPPHVKFR